MALTKITDGVRDTMSATKLTGTIDEARISTLTATKLTGTIDEARISTLTATKLTGNIANARIPASAVSQHVTHPTEVTKSSSDPTISTNPSGGVGTIWLNTTSGEMFICSDATAGDNVWTNVGDGTGNIKSFGAIGDRGIYVQGDTSGSDKIHYISIPTTGNSTTFGDLTQLRGGPPAACSSGSRLVIGGGYTWVGASYRNTIDYITIATTGNATDFGDLTAARSALGACSNTTRGVFAAGHHSSKSNHMDYVTIATTGNATNFGNTTVSRTYVTGCGSDTRGLFFGGIGDPWATYHNVIEYITIATTGNATDFGDMTVSKGERGACSNGTRALIGGGGPSTNVIDYVTIATTGNATDFGDLITSSASVGAIANNTRAVFSTGGSTRNMEYVTIATTGNATDFGDMSIGGNIGGSGD